MAISITVRTAENKNTILNAIREDLIPTWHMDMDGDITLTHTHWRDKAWFRINVDGDNPCNLYFGIIGSRRFPLTNELYGVFHGRLVSTLLAYFNQFFLEFRVITSANPYDVII